MPCWTSRSCRRGRRTAWRSSSKGYVAPARALPDEGTPSCHCGLPLGSFGPGAGLVTLGQTFVFCSHGTTLRTGVDGAWPPWWCVRRRSTDCPQATLTPARPNRQGPCRDCGCRGESKRAACRVVRVERRDTSPVGRMCRCVSGGAGRRIVTLELRGREGFSRRAGVIVGALAASLAAGCARHSSDARGRPGPH